MNERWKYDSSTTSDRIDVTRVNKPSREHRQYGQPRQVRGPQLARRVEPIEIRQTIEIAAQLRHAIAGEQSVRAEQPLEVGRVGEYRVNRDQAR